MFMHYFCLTLFAAEIPKSIYILFNINQNQQIKLQIYDSKQLQIIKHFLMIFFDKI